MRGVVLMYHSIAEPDSPVAKRFSCPPARFAAHMRALRSGAFRVVSLEQLATALQPGSCRPGETRVAVTLDDGYADNHEYALPILTAQGIPATIFVVAGQIGGRDTWTRPAGTGHRPLLSWRQVRELRQAGIRIGAHTLTHPRLPELPDEAARREIRDARRVLEDRLGEAVTEFAYPYGALGEREVRLARNAGYHLACSTRAGFNRPGDDLYRLRRIEVRGTDSTAALLRKLRFGTNDSDLGTVLRYYATRIRHHLALGGVRR